MMSFVDSSENKWRSKECIEIRKKICSKSTVNIDLDEENLLSFFEDLGFLYKRGVIDLDLIWGKV